MHALLIGYRELGSIGKVQVGHFGVSLGVSSEERHVGVKAYVLERQVICMHGYTCPSGAIIRKMPSHAHA